MESILDVSRQEEFTDNIIKNSYHAYYPHNTLTINNSDEIRICINNQNLLTFPSHSYLHIKGKLNNPTNGHLVNNALAFLFSEIRYLIADKEVDMVRNPGIASSMKLVCSANNAARYSNACIDLDENLKRFHKDGSFSGCIPLEMLMGFFEDVNKVIVNVKQELVLKRSKNDNNCILATGTAETDPIPTITLTEIQWCVPHILVSDAEKLSLNRTILSNEPLGLKFRSFELHEMPDYPNCSTRHTWPVKTTNQLEKPRYIIFGFQTARDGVAKSRSDRYDHCGLKNLKVFLNQEYFPYNDLNIDFDKNDVAKVFEMFMRFQGNYYNTSLEPLINRDTYIKEYPLIVVDCSKQNEEVKEGVVDIKLEIETGANVAAGTAAYCLIIHQKEFQYKPLTNELNKV